MDTSIFSIKFSCYYNRCNSFCCRGEDGIGAPLFRKEVILWDNIYYKILEFLPEEKKRIVEFNKGITCSGDKCYTFVDKYGECIFLIRDSNGLYRCAFQRAYEEGVIDFPKPLSCRLFPLRIIEAYRNKYLKFVFYRECRLALNSDIYLVDFLKEPIKEIFSEEGFQLFMKYFDLYKNKDKNSPTSK